MSAIGQENLRSLQQALSLTVMRQALNQDGPTVDLLLQGLGETSNKVLEQSVNPHLGATIDIRI